MKMQLSDKLKSLRRGKGVSQEKMADYLGVSFQTVSKWENAAACPDISLLPAIARYYGITVDELLGAEQINETELYAEYERQSASIFRNGNYADCVPLWEEAYRKMPNNVSVREMLMSVCYDTDKVKYRDRIIELGTEIYSSDCGIYYKGQAICQISRTYAANGNMELAEKWSDRAYQLMHSQEMLKMQILEDGNELTDYFSFANYWYMNCLFWMAARLTEHADTVPGGLRYTHSVDKAVAQLYEIVYPDDDMPFEDLKNMVIQYRSIAEDEIALDNDESVVRHHLTRALACAVKSVSVKEHRLTHPLVIDWHVSDAPSDNLQAVRLLRNALDAACFGEYRCQDWFTEITDTLAGLLNV